MTTSLKSYKSWKFCQPYRDIMKTSKNSGSSRNIISWSNLSIMSKLQRLNMSNFQYCNLPGTRLWISLWAASPLWDLHPRLKMKWASRPPQRMPNPSLRPIRKLQERNKSLIRARLAEILRHPYKKCEWRFKLKDEQSLKIRLIKVPL